MRPVHFVTDDKQLQPPAEPTAIGYVDKARLKGKQLFSGVEEVTAKLISQIRSVIWFTNLFTIRSEVLMTDQVCHEDGWRLIARTYDKRLPPATVAFLAGRRELLMSAIKRRKLS